MRRKESIGYWSFNAREEKAAFNNLTRNKTSR